MLFAVLKDLRGQGLDQTQNKDIITPYDMKVVLNEQSFDNRIPSQFQEKVIFDIVYYVKLFEKEIKTCLQNESDKVDVQCP